jgi:hypothetical protein
LRFTRELTVSPTWDEEGDRLTHNQRVKENHWYDEVADEQEKNVDSNVFPPVREMQNWEAIGLNARRRIVIA